MSVAWMMTVYCWTFWKEQVGGGQAVSAGFVHRLLTLFIDGARVLCGRGPRCRPPGPGPAGERPLGNGAAPGAGCPSAAAALAAVSTD